MATEPENRALARNGKVGAPRGNQNARTHGIYATKDKNALSLRVKRVRRLVRKALDTCSWLQPSDMPTLRSWAETVILKAECFEVLQQVAIYRVDLTNQDVIGKRLLHDSRTLSQLELSYAQALGMTPASRASIRVDALTGDDLAARAARIKERDDN